MLPSFLLRNNPWCPAGTVADDGKRWYSDGRFISKGEMILKKERGGLGERGFEVFPGQRLADIYG